jgi:hypothetical protein
MKMPCKKKANKPALMRQSTEPSLKSIGIEKSLLDAVTSS